MAFDKLPNNQRARFIRNPIEDLLGSSFFLRFFVGDFKQFLKNYKLMY